MRLCNIDKRVNRNRSAIVFSSPRVRSHSSNCRSLMRSSMSSFTSVSIFCGVGFSRLREALSTVSAKTDDGALLRLRFRSAVTKTFFVHLRNVVFAQPHDLATCERVFMLLERALVKITDERCAVMLLNNVDDALV